MTNDRLQYRQRCARVRDGALIDMLVEAVLANGFGHRDTDIEDIRTELLHRMGGAR